MLKFYPAEKTILLITAALGIAAATLAVSKDITIDLDGSGFMLATVSILFGLSQVARHMGRFVRFSDICVVLGLFLLFSFVGANYNVLLLPRPAPPIDAVLVQMDAWFGYSWPAAVKLVAGYPGLAAIMRNIYNFSLLYLLVVFIVVGSMLERERLHQLAYACVFAALITVFSWAFMPSSGASAYWTLDPVLDAIVRPPVNSEYGATLNRMLAEGVTHIDKMSIKGLVGFPSFHTVMVVICVPAIWPMKTLRPVLIFWAAMSLPGILVHGGHNLMDVLGGLANTALAWFVAGRLVAVQMRPWNNEPAAIAQTASAKA